MAQNVISAEAKAMSVAGRTFIFAGRVAGSLPPIRGKVRVLNALHKWLGLVDKPLAVAANLRRPTRYRAQLDMRSWLQRLAFLSGGYEADTVEFLLRLSATGAQRGYLLDIGANIGLISIPFAIRTQLLSPSISNGSVVVAIEAVPANFRALSTNVAINHLQSAVKMFETALGDETKEIEILVEGDLVAGQGTGTASILPSDSTFACVRQRLQLRRLDDLGLPSGCTVIKIDTDGYDLKVLLGADKFLASERPVIFGEFSAHCMQWHEQTVADVVEFCAQRNYQVWQRLADKLSFFETVDPQSYSQDLLLVPVERRQQFLWALDAH